MDSNEIITNEDEVLETAEDIIEVEDYDDEEETDSRTGLKVLAGVGLAALVGTLAYKFAIKPLWTKFKNRKEQKDSEKVTDKDVVTETTAEIVEDETEETN